MKNSLTAFAAFASLALAYSCATQQETAQASRSANSGGTSPIELGSIDWERDFGSAEERAARAHKPLLLLFQEVPG